MAKLGSVFSSGTAASEEECRTRAVFEWFVFDESACGMFPSDAEEGGTQSRDGGTEDDEETSGVAD